MCTQHLSYLLPVNTICLSPCSNFSPFSANISEYSFTQHSASPSISLPSTPPYYCCHPFPFTNHLHYAYSPVLHIQILQSLCKFFRVPIPYTGPFTAMPQSTCCNDPLPPPSSSLITYSSLAHYLSQVIYIYIHICIYIYIYNIYLYI
jgi:hypothetical protein